MYVVIALLRLIKTVDHFIVVLYCIGLVQYSGQGPYLKHTKYIKHHFTTTHRFENI